MSSEPEHDPTDPASYVELPIIHTEQYMREVSGNSDESHSVSSTTAGSRNNASADAASSEPISVVFEVATLANPDTNSSEAGPEETKALGGDQSTASEDGGQAERETSDLTMAGDDTTSSDEKFELPENVVVLRSKSNAPEAECCVYLVGTTHVSQSSCDEVQAVIRNVKPRIVFLELCSSRVAMIMPQKAQKVQVPTFEEMVIAYKKKDVNLVSILYSWLQARIALKLDVVPGSEFRVAFEEACTSGASVVFGDRPMQVTFRRFWARMSTWHKTQLMFLLLFHGIFMRGAEELNQLMEDLKDTDVVTALTQELGKRFPILADTLIHERDLYMAATLRGVARTTSSVVAVVGKGHLRGISENWEADISIEELLTVPKKKPSWFSSPVVRWTTVMVAGGGLAVFLGVHYNQKS